MEIDERIKNMLISDKHFDSRDLLKVLRSDIYELLINYFDITPQDVDVNLSVNEFGIYEFVIKTKCERLKIFGSQIN